MKLAAFLVFGLAVCRLGASEEEAKGETDEAGSKRQMRFLFNWLSAPAAAVGGGVSSLGNSLTSLGNSLSGNTKSETSPKIIYVARPQQEKSSCPLPFFTRGCPSGYFCDLASSGKTQCVPQYPDGARCKTGYQCSSNKCRDDYCVDDKCEVAGETSNCQRGHECVKTKKGYRCQPASKKDQCPTLLEQKGCSENYYCGLGAKGNECKMKLQVHDSCSTSIQCQSGTCRNRRCKSDACPEINMSIDCMASQYCSPGEKGNMCVAKKDNGERCSDNNQCKYHNCERGKCVRDACPVPYMPGRCLSSQFCSPAPNGNVCMPKRDTGEQCDNPAQCKSGRCENHVCQKDECPMAGSTSGCPQQQYCAQTSTGRRCLAQRADGVTCTSSVMCINNCVSGRCSSATSTMLSNGASCAIPTQCSSGNCVLGRCAASRNAIGGMCFDSDDCQSMTCTNMRCAMPTETTTTSATTAATAATTTASADTTTTATTTTAATLAAIGEACMMDSMCMTMRCGGNMQCAAARVAIGQSCNVADDCISNVCTDSTCRIGTTAGGAPCTDSQQCATGACIDNLCFAP